MNPKFMKVKDIFNKNMNNPDFYSLVGHLLGDGGWSKDGIGYYNTRLELINDFKRRFDNIFGEDIKQTVIEPKNNNCKIGYRLTYYSRKLINELNNLDINIIENKSDKCKIEFLRALFDDEGSVAKDGTIGLLMKDEKLINLLIRLLNDTGIRNIKRYKVFNKKYQRYYYAFRISKKDNKIFKEKISFIHIPKLKRLEDNPYMFELTMAGLFRKHLFNGCKSRKEAVRMIMQSLKKVGFLFDIQPRTEKSVSEQFSRIILDINNKKKGWWSQYKYIEDKTKSICKIVSVKKLV